MSGVTLSLTIPGFIITGLVLLILLVAVSVGLFYLSEWLSAKFHKNSEDHFASSKMFWPLAIFSGPIGWFMLFKIRKQIKDLRNGMSYEEVRYKYNDPTSRNRPAGAF